MRILSNANSTRAFFGKKIILVEGQTDQYFFKAALEKSHPELMQEITVTDISGKKEYKAWKSFFEAFGLTVYYIGDFDNVEEFKLSQYKRSKIKKQIENTLKQNKLDKLTEKQKKELEIAHKELVKNENFIMCPQRTQWKNLLDIFMKFVAVKATPHEILSKMKEMDSGINTEIDKKYFEKIYILKFGALEDYTETKHGRLDEIISFCENKLSDWLRNDSNEKDKEIKEIIQQITIN